MVQDSRPLVAISSHISVRVCLHLRCVSHLIAVHLVGADDGHRTEVLVAGNFVTSLLGAHATNIYHSRHLKLCPDTAAHAVSVANTRYHVIYERPFLALSLWAFILYTIKYGGRVRNV